MVGQDAVATAEAFRDGVGITGVVLSKLDGDARGGAALSVREVTGQPILFASTGEKLEDFDVFHPDRMASRILGMGDVLTLIEQAEQAFDDDQKEQDDRQAHGRRAVHPGGLPGPADRACGGWARSPTCSAMMPGMDQMKDQLAELDDKHFDRVTAIIRSMTPGERTNPKIINGSRRARIANGSGVTVMDVNQLLNRFADAQKMMKQMGGMMGLPGQPAQGHQVARRTSARVRRAATGRAPAAALPGGRLPGRHAAAAAGHGPGRAGRRRAGPAARLQAPEARLQQAHQAARRARAELASARRPYPATLRSGSWPTTSR